MDYSATKKVFIFVDESGDPGEHSNISDNFIINAAVTTEEGVQDMGELISGYNFFNNGRKELKKLKGKDLEFFSSKLFFLSNVKFYEMVIDKKRYNGPYLRKNSLWFRNFVLIKVLEYIARSENLFAFNKPIELVIDRYVDNTEDSDNLRNYLAGKIPRSSPVVAIPRILPSHIVFLDSRYCPQIQLLDVIQRLKKVDDLDLPCESIPSDDLHTQKGPGCPDGTGALSH